MSVLSDQLPITSPCPITLDREGTTPQDRRMHCAHCVKDVHLLSNMNEREARAVLSAMAGQDICVSYAIRPDGQIRFADSPRTVSAPTRAASSTPAFVPVSALSRRSGRRRTRRGDETLRATSPGAVLAGIGAALALAACTPHSNGPMIDSNEQQVTAPFEAGVIIPDQQPCDTPVEGGIKAEPLPLDVQVDGGIGAVELPQEIQVAGGLRAEDVEPDQLPEPNLPPPAQDPDQSADAVEVHTPTPRAEPEQRLRGRIAPRHLDDERTD